MQQRTKSLLTGLVAGGAGLLVLLAAFGLAVVYTGRLNVAATEEHTSFVRWAFDTTFQNSVQRRAGGVVAPEAVTQAMIESGADHYKAMCEHCHAGPGSERADWASGMRPRPPHPAEAAAHWELEEVFWLVRHGVRMTGMPAFGPTHDDRTLWGIAAFVKELPAMTPEQYATLSASEADHAADGGHAH
jgi:mono/diheme cytochrome c family protein